MNGQVLTQEPGTLVRTYKGVEITAGKLRRLQGGQKLDDELVMVFLEMLVDEANAREGKSLLLMDTFFHQLKSVDPARWRKKVKVSSYKKVLSPLHTPDHWSLIVVDLERGSIMLLDSLGLQHPEQVARTRNFIEARLELEGKAISLREEAAPEGLARQEMGDHINCGLYVTQYARRVLHNLPMTVPLRITPLRQTMLFEIATGQLVF